MTDPAPTLTAQEAAEYTGYGSKGKFLRAVEHGVFPPPMDRRTRPMRWSRSALDERLHPTEKKRQNDPEVEALDRALGLA